LCTPIRCDVPLVDAVYMTCPQGVLIPLANYTLQPIAALKLQIHLPRPIVPAQSVRRRPISLTTTGPNRAECMLPLDAMEFIKLYY
jgi:hypothetical protein